MKTKEKIDVLKVAKAEVEWEYPLTYHIALDQALKFLKGENIDKDIVETLTELNEKMEWIYEPIKETLKIVIGEISSTACRNCNHGYCYEDDEHTFFCALRDSLWVREDSTCIAYKE